MSEQKKKNSSSVGSVLGKVAIGVAGIIGGLLLGKAIQQATKDQNKTQSKPKITVDPTQYTKNVQDYDNVEELMTCPITNCIMRHPVIIIQCGHTFEKQQIQKWVKAKQHCPLCNTKTSTESLKPNYQLQQVIAEYLNRKKKQRQQEQKIQKKLQNDQKIEKKQQKREESQ